MASFIDAVHDAARRRDVSDLLGEFGPFATGRLLKRAVQAGAVTTGDALSIIEDVALLPVGEVGPRAKLLDDTVEQFKAGYRS